MDRETKYWVIVASRDHVKAGIPEGIAQACHGRSASLQKMRKGDFIVYYSGKQHLGQVDKCQEFTAIGQVKDEHAYSFHVSADFCPSRRNIDYFDHRDVSILPLIGSLEFIRDKQRWGFPFRFGFLEIGRKDFELISAQMLHTNG